MRSNFSIPVVVELTDEDIASTQVISMINDMQKLKSVVVVLFGSGKSLAALDAITAPVIWCGSATPVSAQYAAQVVFGGIAVTQKLDKAYSAKYVTGAGFTTAKTRLQYTVPESAGINSNNLLAIDSIAMDAIRQRATPGWCLVLAVKDGKVIFNKAYGYHTYEQLLPDKITDIFDLASMTKITATTMEAMQLTGQGQNDHRFYPRFLPRQSKKHQQKQHYPARTAASPGRADTRYTNI